MAAAANRDSSPKLETAHAKSGPAAESRTPETITSRDNRWLKRFSAALAGEAPRGAAGEGETAAVEGSRLVMAALEAARVTGGPEILAVLTSASGARHLSRLAGSIPPSARLLHTDDRLFEQIAATEAPQGIAALVRLRVTTFDDLVSGVPLVLVLAGVQDPGNVGVMLRTAEAFGATGAAACAAGGMGTANPFGPKALRASAGAALRLPVLRAPAAPLFLEQLRVAGLRIFAACADDADVNSHSPLAPWEIDWRAPSALLVGNEGAGLPEDVVRAADQIVRIPQAGPRAPGAPAPESLNAAVAGGVLLYEAARQRGLR